jgi:ABC-type sulfate/molybdate transport systems ATPase subunit
MITHNEEIAQMADRILQIEDGKIVSDSSISKSFDFPCSDTFNAFNGVSLQSAGL